MMTRFLKDAAIVTTAFAAYAGALIALRPWHTRWGATDNEVREHLPGDELAPNGAVCNHAITIHAPVSEVWNWLVQIGQDRGGFYSYTWLENLFLCDMHNADRIVPDWQNLQKGDYVRLASKKVYGNVPLLRVAALEPEHYIVLEGWGAFVLEPIDTRTTRMIIRSHGTKPMGGPLLNFLFWDPAHFIMERGMLRGIKRRAERTRV
jgi:hypothetical protein